MRRSVIVVVSILMLGSVSGCGATSEPTATSSTRSGAADSASAETASEWLAKWGPMLSTDYGPAQKTFLAAIKTGQATAVQTAAQTVVDANERLDAAIDAAGPPPKSEAGDVTKLKRALTKEATLLRTVLQTCTDPNQACQDAVTSYAKNNAKQIIPALTALGAQ
jgi:hypothetical protein